MTTLQKSIYCIAMLSIALTGCKKDETAKEAELKPGELPPTQNPAFMNLDASPAVTTTATPAPAANSASPVTATAPGMNPPHGQPGHRCEIPVGAPLNSKPGAATTAQAPQPATTQPVQFAPPVTKEQPASVTPVTTAPGMNPPHGQPGHRCDVAVGAPLP